MYMTKEQLKKHFKEQIKNGETAECPVCHRIIAWDEYATNLGMCDECFNKMTEEDHKKGLI